MTIDYYLVTLVCITMVDLSFFSKRNPVIKILLVLILIAISFQIRDALNVAFPVPGINHIIITLVSVPIIFFILYKIIMKYSNHISEKIFSITVVAIFTAMIISSLLMGFFGNESLQPESIHEIR